MKSWVAAAVAMALIGGSARGADRKALEALRAPPPAETQYLPAGVPLRAVRISRVVVQLKPEPWALVRDLNSGRLGRLVTRNNGEQEVKTSVVSGIFDEEITKSGGKSIGASQDFFSQASSADFLIAVKVGDMAGNLCQYCDSHLTLLLTQRWHGVVTMNAHWEIYSTLERKVVATIETSGGFASPKAGLDGEPDRLINEAFRDNVRRLIGSEEFRRIVTTPIGAPHSDKPSAEQIVLHSTKPVRILGEIGKSVAIVFAADGSGSGFVVSDDGYLLTNQHVVGGSKYVKLKWVDGSESLGEVIRSDVKWDVALIKTDIHGRPPLDTRSGPVHQGQTVFAIGSPLGDKFQNTMSRGIVSAIRTEDGQSLIQSDVMVNHGSSGGPLLDETGNVIGLTVSGQAPNGDPVGLNFFIPIGDALRVLGLVAPPESTVQQAVAAPPSRTATKH